MGRSIILDRAGRMQRTAPNAAGNWNGTQELTWDAWSRVTSVKNNGTEVGTYTYDGIHRRITNLASGILHHAYYSDAWRPLEERKDAETTATISYLWGARHRDDLVRRDRAVGGTTLNETRYVLMDYYNPSAITDESGVVKERYSFSAFGVRSILAPDYTARTSSESAFDFAFQGQFLDSESGLMNYGYRYYSPYLGRWTCKDPIAERGGINLYGIVGNRLVNLVDRLGLGADNCDECEGGLKKVSDDYGKECCEEDRKKDEKGLYKCDAEDKKKKKKPQGGGGTKDCSKEKEAFEKALAQANDAGNLLDRANEASKTAGHNNMVAAGTDFGLHLAAKAIPEEFEKGGKVFDELVDHTTKELNERAARDTEITKDMQKQAQTAYDAAQKAANKAAQDWATCENDGRLW